MKDQYYLYAGHKKKAFFSLPGGWQSLYFVQPGEEASALPSVQGLFSAALAEGSGPVPLGGKAPESSKVAVVVDDLTRPTPVQEILSLLFPYLEKKGYSRESVTIVIALGTHAPLTREQLLLKLGEKVLSTYPVVQHNAWQKDLVPVPLPGTDKVVKINPSVMAADLRIGISSILPHPMAGFGGGPKIITPGVADFDFIKAHHAGNVLHPRAALGVTKGNPFHEGIAAATRAVGLQFSINCVYDASGQIAGITAGDPEIAYKQAVDLCFEKLGYTFKEKVDVTIASAFPHSHGNQLFKGLMAASMVTREEGAVLLFCPLAEPIPAEFLNSIRKIREASRDKPAEYIEEKLSRGQAFLPDKPMDYNMAMTNVFIRPKMRVILVSGEIREDEASVMGLEHAPSIEEGLARLERQFPRARTAILPAGGLILPVMA